MAEKLTLKQEGFAKTYVETGNASEAYRQNYNAGNMKPETIHVKACELLANGKVSARVAQLQQSLVKRHEVTVDSLIAELEEARQLAKAEGQSGGAVQASMGKAKLCGLLVERQRVDVTGNHTVNHVSEPVSATSEWVAGLLGTGQDEQAKNPLPN